VPSDGEEEVAERLAVLDAQRGLCAVFVAVLHAKGASHIHESPFVEGSWLFVDFFSYSAVLSSP